MLSALLHLLSPAGPRGRLSVLIFHRVLPVPDAMFPEEVDAARFDAVCGWVKSLFNVLPLDEAVQRRRAGSLPPRALSITFDDGYADNFEVALPILRRHGLTACFFVATGFLDGGRMFNDTVIEAVRRSPLDETKIGDELGLDHLGVVSLRGPGARRALVDTLLPRIKYMTPGERIAVGERLADQLGSVLPDDLMMRSEQVVAMRAAGMQIGAHTVDHPILARLPDSQACEQILGSRRHLEELLGERIGLFAYPNGKPGRDFSPRTVDLVREAGFDAAFTTAWGAAGSAMDAFRLPRFSPWEPTRGRYALSLARNLTRR